MHECLLIQISLHFAYTSIKSSYNCVKHKGLPTIVIMPSRILRKMSLRLRQMNWPHLPSRLRHGLLVFISALTFVLPAHAGNIFFGLSINGTKITLTNQGNSTAFHPVVMRLHADGHWVPLPFPPEVRPPAELPAGAQVDFLWLNLPPHNQPSQLELLNPVMVRFFDQAGNSFGQISFFNQPSLTSDLSQTGYVKGLMTIAPPVSPDGSAIRASWLLWPQEEGIAPLTKPVRFEYTQPPAKRIEWQPGMDKLRLDLGAGLPAAILLHETAHGLMLQNLINGGVQGSQQRTAWLDSYGLFFNLAYLAAAVAAVLMLWHLASKWRERTAT
jgi:hypothetical protein